MKRPDSLLRGGVLTVLAALILAGCGKGDDNSPDMGAVAPKPNLSAAANAPGGASSNAKLDNGASALAPTAKP